MAPTIHDFENSIIDLNIEKATAICRELKSSKSEDVFDANFKSPVRNEEIAGRDNET